ncbi:hypothetical protein GCM10010377_68160 [Streptomyces viridiviolaceus]|uniref:Rieske (2Fe-2S) protein n=1 Tax=Streptomyces viridiviolaceus TaxID=68282 RepID=A0ABW2E7Y9_9ACTN|nr:hypothetical protein GCM10010377_68160 [Streptomyces viridiviolaceus]
MDDASTGSNHTQPANPVQGGKRGAQVVSIDCLRQLKERKRLVLELRAPRERILVLWSRRGPYAVESHCPHRLLPLDDAEISGGELTCRAHGWSFSLETGECTNPPSRGAALRRYPVWVADGLLCLDRM